MNVQFKSNRIIYLLLLILWIAAPEYLSANDNSIRWRHYTAGMKSAKSLNLPVFLHFYADWCGYCEKMEKETFQDKAVIEYLNKNYIAIKANFDNKKELAIQYAVRALPATFFIGSDGERVGPIHGYVSKETLMGMLKKIR